MRSLTRLSYHASSRQNGERTAAIDEGSARSRGRVNETTSRRRDSRAGKQVMRRALHCQFFPDHRIDRRFSQLNGKFYCSWGQALKVKVFQSRFLRTAGTGCYNTAEVYEASSLVTLLQIKLRWRPSTYP